MAPTHIATQKPGLRERKKRATRAAILKAASDLFARDGFEATSVEKIAEQANLSRQTCFNYFSTKPAIAAALSEAMLISIQDAVAEARAVPASTAERLGMLFTKLADGAEADPQTAHFLVCEAVVTPRDQATRRKIASRVHATFEALLQDGLDAGDLRRDYELAHLARIVSAGLGECMVTWGVNRRHPLRRDLEETARFLGETLSRAAETRPPRRRR
ncbi:MAG: TetR/AcrR family transcriptional regulator [Deltaproteobacteria bacterium]